MIPSFRNRSILRLVLVGLLACLAVAAGQQVAAQTTTQVMVRVVANDAKIIGSGVGGALVTIRDVQTGSVLAAGVQEGATGNTDLIMRRARERGGKVYSTEGAAGFLATLSLERPTLVEISAEGPLGTPHAVQRASTTSWLVPGHDVVGDGIVLNLLGFTVKLESPGLDQTLKAGADVAVRANVTMLCGCPTEPGGLWDSDDYTIVARWVRDGVVLGERTLDFAGETSTYGGAIPAPSEGTVELHVLAMDAGTGNFGMATRALRIVP